MGGKANRHICKRCRVSKIDLRDILVTNVSSSSDAKSRPSVNSLRCAARTLQEWKDLAEITGEADGAVFKKLKDELAELWKDLGFSGELGGGRE
jgi:hypothetical protein